MARTRTWWAACAALLGAACAGPSAQHKLSLNSRIASRDWAGAVGQLERAKASEYASRDEVLYWLDVAAVLHDAGKWRESDKALDQAEQRLEALYTQSISKGAATFFVNDTTDDYRGEPHERSLLHILRALNYAYAGASDEAVVESRKVTTFLTELGTTVGSRYTYRDDAFAQYLSALLFEDAGHPDDARISYQAAHTAYQAYAAAYGTQEPGWKLPPMHQGEGEIVFLHYVGVAPRRSSQTIQVAWNDAIAAINATSGDDEDAKKAQNAIVAGLSANAITVAFPEQIQDPFLIQGSEIEVAGKLAPTVVVEDISAIAARALDDRMGIIRSRAIARRGGDQEARRPGLGTPRRNGDARRKRRNRGGGYPLLEHAARADPHGARAGPRWEAGGRRPLHQRPRPVHRRGEGRRGCHRRPPHLRPCPHRDVREEPCCASPSVR